MNGQRLVYPTADEVLPFSEDPGIARFVPHVAAAIRPVEPLGPAVPVPDLLSLHASAGIQLRVLPQPWAFWDAVVAAACKFSGIRLRNAVPPR